ncbi:DUF3267 domain-containing protein [Maribellus sediminis]|uniref:DUF3267 domain-containing protein n=1 Tax=Maribellus sediminis TaxID=2696285 RepID=UPI0014302812|nr:DUF3267 domain-containing protein [Maribellus sediminis]
MSNPTIEELLDGEQFELIAELEHATIKEFVLEQLATGGKIITAFMVYQVIMLLAGIFFVTRSIVMAYHGINEPLIFSGIALLFCFTLLIPIHELLHGLALKLTGAEKIYYGAYFRKFIFYAEADQHVLNKSQFELIALAPLVVVKILTIIGLLIFFNSPVFYLMIMIMAVHSFFCAGDIGLLSLFYRHRDVFTYDVRSEKKSYYFKRR